jgi:hypothetical protein
MSGCTGDCNQGRLPCNCKGLTNDHGKEDRMRFLEQSLQEARWDRYVKWILIIMILYFGAHIYNALAQSTPVIINQPDGRQTVCIVDGRYITCF